MFESSSQGVVVHCRQPLPFPSSLSHTVRMDSFNGSEAPMVHYQQDQVIVTEVEERERTAAELVELEK